MQPPRRWVRPALTASTGAGKAFAAIAGAALDQVAANARGAAQGANPEYLHQLRVGVRRLRSAMRAFRGLLRRSRADSIEDVWRGFMRTLGEARDWDVFERRLEPGPLKRLAAARRAPAQRRVRRLLASRAFLAAQRRTRAWAQADPWRRHADDGQPLRRLARHALARMSAELRDAAEGIDWRDAGARHCVRIRLKRLRYACDFFAPALHRRRGRALLAWLHWLQDLLGELNDLQVQARLLRELRRGGGDDVAKALPARGLLAARRHALIAELGQAWSEFASLQPAWR